MSNYTDYYWEQSGENRFRMNELVIWAVSKLTDTETNTTGIKIHLDGRLYQLVRDTKYERWRQASKRFRGSVDKWIKRHESYETKSYDLLLRGI